MSTFAHINEKYGTKAAPKEQKTPFILPNQPEKSKKSAKTGNIGHGCGKCGCREYLLHRTKLWQCAECGSFYPYISALKHIQRDGQTVHWLHSCSICAGPWLMRSVHGFYFCPFCQDFPVDTWQVLVFAGDKRSNSLKSREN